MVPATAARSRRGPADCPPNRKIRSVQAKAVEELKAVAPSLPIELGFASVRTSEQFGPAFSDQPGVGKSPQVLLRPPSARRDADAPVAAPIIYCPISQ